jgi:CSLREA domain-containing protein
LPIHRRLRLEPLEDRRLLALVTVDTLADTVDANDGVTSLREAIITANLVAGADEIDFAPSLTSGGPATITLTLGELAITDDLAITGPGATLLTIDANDPTPDENNGDGSRVFNVDDGDAAVHKVVAISGLTLTGGDVAGYGGAISSRENLTLTGCTLSGNAATEGGGALTTSGLFDEVLIEDSTLSDNRSGNTGGAIDARGRVTLHDTTVTGNSGTIGGAIFHQGAYNRRLTIIDSTISGNSATSGGGIAEGYLTIVGSTISHNTSLTDGGGMVLNGGDLMITSSVVNENTAALYGAGIRLAGFASATITDCDISGNAAGALGGGILSNISINPGLTVTGTTISNNLGGGIAAGFAPLAVERCTITGNSVVGIFTQFNRVTVVESTISGNTDNGGMFIDGGTATITRSTISGNSSFYDGGGIAGQFTTITLESSTVSGNASSGYGGGVAAGYFTDLLIANSTISGNSADFGGGGILTDVNAMLSHMIVAGNTVGGVPSDVSGTATVEFSLVGVDIGATIIDNGGNLIGTTAAPVDPLLAPLADNGGPTLTHALLPGSPAINRGDLTAVAGVGDVPEFDQRGAPFGRVFWVRIDIGSFEYQAPSDLNLVVDTLADESDGDYALGDVSLREAILLANTYPSDDTIRFDPALAGGTILLTMGELLITDDTTIEGLGASLLTIDANDPTPDDNNGDGSRVFNIDDGSASNLLHVSISDLTLTGGDVSGDGGAIRSTENIAIANSTLSGNSADNGGAVWCSGAATITTSTISENSAVRDGGGILGGVTLDVTNSTISGNTAGRDGGGIRQGPAVRVSVTDSTINNNSAGRDGGGLQLTIAMATITRSAVSHNTAGRDGGGIFRAASGLSVLSCTISSNSASRNGGGIWGTEVSVADSTISGNSASEGGAIWTATALVSNTTIKNNSTSGNGAGIRATGPLSVISSTVSGNSAIGNGGGIWKSGASSLSVTSSTMSGNSASSGAAIFTEGAATIRHGTIAFNATTGVGTGIFVNGGSLLLDRSIVAQNTGASGDINGLAGTTITAHYSLVGNNDGSGLAPAPVGMPDANGNLIGTSADPIDPQLGSLADNGGPTLTHALLAGSPAIDAGNPIFGPPPSFDQRGAPFARVSDGDGAGGARIDMGAYELQPIPPAILGDYNQDSTTDAADYVVWRKLFGTTGVPPYTSANGNGDQTIDSLDYGVWRLHFGTLVGAGSGPIMSMVDGGVMKLAPTLLPSAAESRTILPKRSSIQPGIPQILLSLSDAALMAWLNSPIPADEVQVEECDIDKVAVARDAVDSVIDTLSGDMTALFNLGNL